MRAVVVYPGQDRPPGVDEIEPPLLVSGALRIRVLRVGVCGTDREIVAGGIGTPPPGTTRLVLGHESFGQVVESATPEKDAPMPGDYVVATVRRGCGRCRFCLGGMSDFCTTGEFVERGILGADGFLAEQYVERPEYLVRVPGELESAGVLLEPLSVVEKAMQQSFAAQARVPSLPTASRQPWLKGESGWRPENVLVLGVGPIGLLAAATLRLAGAGSITAVERTARPVKAALLETVGVSYRPAGGAPLHELLGTERFDLILEATGSGRAAIDAIPLLAPNGVACLTGIFPGGTPAETVALNDLLREMVYRNQALVTSVNSNRSYFERGVTTMQAIELRWPGLLERLITRRVPMERYAEALDPGGNDVKAVVEVGAASG